MNGLSFYSECLQITYDMFIFAGLAHRMYIPMSDETMCIKPANFTFLYPSIDFGLVIHSSLNVSRLRLNNFIQLLPGYNGTAVSLGFYKDTSERVGLIHSLEMTMFDRAFVTQARLKNMELSFGLMMNLFNKELYAAHIQGLASTSRQWKDMAVSVRGWFPKGNGSFVDTMERSVIQTADMRKKKADQQLSEATARLERAERQLNAANRMLASASNNVNAVEADLVESRECLRQAEINVTMARSETREAEKAIGNVCELQDCPFKCQNATRKRTVYKDKYYEICGSNYNITISIRVAPFSEVLNFIQCYYKDCNGVTCKRELCSFICKSVNSTHPLFNYRDTVIEAPCKVSCTVSQYGATIEATEDYIDPCGRREPDASCIAMNANCNRDREAALRALEMRRSELVAPLRERNRARAEVELLEVRLSQAQHNKQLANEALASARSLYNFKSYPMILKEIEANALLCSRAQQHGSNVFNITNITFSVSISEQKNPSAFPITITYDALRSKTNQLNYFYQFDVPFSSQKEALVNNIIDFSSKREREWKKAGKMYLYL